MGFLLGAFGKLAAGQRYRGIQAQMMRIQSKLRIASRQVANYSKMLENNKKSELNGLNAYFANMKNNVAMNVQNELGLNDPAKQSDTNLMAMYTHQITAATAQLEAQKSYQEQQIINKYEYMNDMTLEPLKMEEDALQLEKDSLESQLQMAKADYEACQKMEQTDAKDMAPKYTSGG